MDLKSSCICIVSLFNKCYYIPIECIQLITKLDLQPLLKGKAQNYISPHMEVKQCIHFLYYRMLISFYTDENPPSLYDSPLPPASPNNCQEGSETASHSPDSSR